MGSTGINAAGVRAPDNDQQDHAQELTRDEKIRRRAYEIYLELGREPGRDLEHWLQAENEVAAEESNRTAANA